METAPPADSVLALVVTAGATACAISIEHVAETMRPLPVEPVAHTPGFVQGLAVIRGAPVPVVDLPALLGGASRAARSGRFVTLKLDHRRLALAVDSVLGLRRLDPRQLEQLPPLLRDAAPGLIESLGSADAQLLVVLRASRLIPDAVWKTLAAKAEA